MKKVLTIFAALTLLLCAATAQANLITNGTFDNNLDGWNTLITSPSWDAATQSAKFGSSGGIISLPTTQNLYQNFYIAPGTSSLTLSFDISISKSAMLVALNSFSVFFNSFDLGFEDFSLFNWVSTDDAYTATITKEIDFNFLIGLQQNATLLFSFTGTGGVGNTTILIDNVMMAANAAPAVPVPAAVWLLGSGLTGMMALRRRMN